MAGAGPLRRSRGGGRGHARVVSRHAVMRTCLESGHPERRVGADSAIDRYDRPYITADDMDQSLIETWAEEVSARDRSLCADGATGGVLHGANLEDWQNSLGRKVTVSGPGDVPRVGRTNQSPFDAIKPAITMTTKSPLTPRLFRQSHARQTRTSASRAAARPFLHTLMLAGGRSRPPRQPPASACWSAAVTHPLQTWSPWSTRRSPSCGSEGGAATRLPAACGVFVYRVIRQ